MTLRRFFFVEFLFLSFSKTILVNQLYEICPMKKLENSLTKRENEEIHNSNICNLRELINRKNFGTGDKLPLSACYPKNSGKYGKLS